MKCCVAGTRKKRCKNVSTKGCQFSTSASGSSSPFCPVPGQQMPPPPRLTPPRVPVTPPEFQLKPARQPVLWAALAYASGIIAGAHLLRPDSWWVGAGIAFIAAGLYFLRKRTWLGATLAVGAFFLAGALHIQLRGPATLLDTTLQPYTDGQQVELTAHVMHEGRLREAASNEVRQSIDVQSE